MAQEDRKDLGFYKYYLLGEDIPIRVAFDTNKRKMGADIPDIETGSLIKRAAYLSVVETSPDIEEIDKETFDKLCLGHYQKKNDVGPANNMV